MIIRIMMILINTINCHSNFENQNKNDFVRNNRKTNRLAVVIVENPLVSMTIYYYYTIIISFVLLLIHYDSLFIHCNNSIHDKTCGSTCVMVQNSGLCGGGQHLPQ